MRKPMPFACLGCGEHRVYLLSSAAKRRTIRVLDEASIARDGLAEDHVFVCRSCGWFDWLMPTDQLQYHPDAKDRLSAAIWPRDWER